VETVRSVPALRLYSDLIDFLPLGRNFSAFLFHAIPPLSVLSPNMQFVNVQTYIRACDAVHDL
jgi:hypothetical protein